MKLRRSILTGVTAGAMLAMFSGCDGVGPFGRGGASSELTKKEKGLLSLAVAMERSGKSKEAEKLFQEAMDASNGSVAAHLGLAGLYFREGKDDEANALLAEAERKQPDDPTLNQLLGKRAIRQDKPAEALEHFERGLKSRPENVTMLNGKGIALDSLSRHEEATKAYELALTGAKGEDVAMVNNNLALSYIMSGAYDKAVALLEPLAQKEDSVVVRQNLALAYGLGGNMRKAGEWAGKDLKGEQLTQNIRFYRQYHDNRILQTALPMDKPTAPTPPANR